MKPKILIKIKAGQIEEIVCTTPDIEIYAMDMENLDEECFPYYKSQGDETVSDEQFTSQLSELETQADEHIKTMLS